MTRLSFRGAVGKLSLVICHLSFVIWGDTLGRIL